MLKINKTDIDLVLTLEEHSSIDKVLDLLSLDIKEILIICPKLFLQRFIGSTYDGISDNHLHAIEEGMDNESGVSSVKLNYKGKLFTFNFIISQSETKHISHPIKGDEIYKVGFKVIDI